MLIPLITKIAGALGRRAINSTLGSVRSECVQDSTLERRWRPAQNAQIGIRNSLLKLGLLFALLVFATSNIGAQEEDRLQIGVTLHPYYSWVANIVGERGEVIPVIPENADPHAYQPVPEDLEKLSRLDVIVINGLGHDEFIQPMLKAAGQETIERINPNEGVPLIPIEGKHYGSNPATADAKVGNGFNSHSFLSIISAVQQINNIAAGLARLDPEHAATYQDNARAYAKRLRKLLAGTLAQVNEQDIEHIKIATVHDGYAYLFQELGLVVEATIQPRHGIDPSPKQLADTIRQLKAANVDILFTEMDYNKQFVDVIREETKTQIFPLTHISKGPYEPQKFETEITNNLQNIVAALENLL
jgi:zinc transport system substrate-binding protein